MIYPESMKICFKGNQASFKELHTITINYFWPVQGLLFFFRREVAALQRVDVKISKTKVGFFM